MFTQDAFVKFIFQNWFIDIGKLSENIDLKLFLRALRRFVQNVTYELTLPAPCNLES